MAPHNSRATSRRNVALAWSKNRERSPAEHVTFARCTAAIPWRRRGVVDPRDICVWEQRLPERDRPADAKPYLEHTESCVAVGGRAVRRAKGRTCGTHGCGFCSRRRRRWLGGTVSVRRKGAPDPEEEEEEECGHQQEEEEEEEEEVVVVGA